MAIDILSSVRVLELAAIGPVPWAGMLMADMGARVVRIERPGSDLENTPTNRGRTVVQLDLKSEAGHAGALELIRRADVLIEGMRPGALERLGLSPESCHQINPRLVIGRMTGWGQEGPLADRAGHDINYIALSGVLHAIGRERPVPPLNLIADYGGGGAFLLIGVLAALLRARSTGHGEIVDAAMVDGSASLATLIYERLMRSQWIDERASNSLDGGTPWYDVYCTQDEKFVAVGCNEPQFYAEFLRGLGLDADKLPPRGDRANWPALRARFAARFAERTRDEWTQVFQGTDACVTPVLSLLEAPGHPHNIARRTFRDFSGHPVPAPAPRFGGRISEPAGPSAAETLQSAIASWSDLD